MNSLHKNTLRILRWLFGAVFVFSGFVKAIDPLGGSYKFQDYFAAMGLESLSAFALVLSVLLSALEMVIGLNLIAGIRLKETSWVALLFMLFMTGLTAWIYKANPVHDCGCFGDALVISNKATFYKNIVLLAMIIGILVLRKHHTTTLRPLSEWILVAFSFFSVMTLSHFNYHYLPMVDFRPYKIGANIPEGMKIPDGAPKDEYTTTFIYAKNGVKKEFTLNNYPATDSTWKFVDQKTVLVKEGYKPPIHDFSIQSSANGEITDIVLGNKGYSFLLVAYDLNKAATDRFEKINTIADYAKKNNYPFYCLTASTGSDVDDFVKRTGLKAEICNADPIMLKTTIRSNPGLILLHNGTVINHWPNGWLPSFDKPLSNNPKDEMPTIPSWLLVMAVAIAYTTAFIVLRQILIKRFQK
ncbi:MAG: DoxX family protein [Bacteroidota bacterium]|nr:DoxX family protein [Bacteroidota bacterium]